MSVHWIEKCPNGHVVSQCRCIGPKTVRIVPISKCVRCRDVEGPR